MTAVDGAQLTIIAGPGKIATSISAETPSWWVKLGKSNPLLLMIVPLGLFLLLSVRNKRKQEKAQQERLGSIKRGDRIQTIGGIIGNVVQTEEGRVLVKVDESNNTKIWFARSAVGRVLGEENRPTPRPRSKQRKGSRAAHGSSKATGVRCLSPSRAVSGEGKRAAALL